MTMSTKNTPGLVPGGGQLTIYRARVIHPDGFSLKGVNHPIGDVVEVDIHVLREFGAPQLGPRRRLEEVDESAGPVEAETPLASEDGETTGNAESSQNPRPKRGGRNK